MVQVHLRRGQRRVAENLLHGVDIAAAPQIVNREPKAQVVEAEGLEGVVQLGGPFDDGAELV